MFDTDTCYPLDPPDDADSIFPLNLVCGIAACREKAVYAGTWIHDGSKVGYCRNCYPEKRYGLRDEYIFVQQTGEWIRV